MSGLEAAGALEAPFLVPRTSMIWSSDGFQSKRETKIPCTPKFGPVSDGAFLLLFSCLLSTLSKSPNCQSLRWIAESSAVNLFRMPFSQPSFVCVPRNAMLHKFNIRTWAIDAYGQAPMLPGAAAPMPPSPRTTTWQPAAVMMMTCGGDCQGHSPASHNASPHHSCCQRGPLAGSFTPTMARPKPNQIGIWGTTN
jgi:hypothetical protein